MASSRANHLDPGCDDDLQTGNYERTRRGLPVPSRQSALPELRASANDSILDPAVDRSSGKRYAAF